MLNRVKIDIGTHTVTDQTSTVQCPWAWTALKQCSNSCQGSYYKLTTNSTQQVSLTGLGCCWKLEWRKDSDPGQVTTNKISRPLSHSWVEYSNNKSCDAPKMMMCFEDAAHNSVTARECSSLENSDDCRGAIVMLSKFSWLDPCSSVKIQCSDSFIAINMSEYLMLCHWTIITSLKHDIFHVIRLRTFEQCPPFLYELAVTFIVYAHSLLL